MPSLHPECGAPDEQSRPPYGPCVALGTIRVKLIAPFWQAPSTVPPWFLAISRVMNDLDNPANFVGYAGGFAAGTFLGITLEQWIASGSVLIPVVTISQ